MPTTFAVRTLGFDPLRITHRIHRRIKMLTMRELVLKTLSPTYCSPPLLCGWGILQEVPFRCDPMQISQREHRTNAQRENEKTHLKIPLTHAPIKTRLHQRRTPQCVNCPMKQILVARCRTCQDQPITWQHFTAAWEILFQIYLGSMILIVS